MKQVILILAILLTTNVYSQQWCPPGAKWTYNLSAWEAGGYTTFYYEKDTIIASQPCKKIIGTDIFNSRWSPQTDTNYLNPEYTFAKDDTVFFWSKNSFYPAYYFNAQIGDTISMLNPNSLYCYLNDSTMRHIVDSVNVIQLNNRQLRYYRTRNVKQRASYPEFIEVIEGIGAINSYIYPAPVCVFDIEPEFSLRCYEDSLFPLYKTDSLKACDYIRVGTHISGATSNTHANVYPNPASHTLQLQLQETPAQQTYLQICDALGREVMRQEITSSHTTINRQNLVNGFYFWNVYTGDKQTGRGKLLFE